MIQVQIAGHLSPSPELAQAAELLPRAARETLQRAAGPDNASLTILITDDRQLQALNYQYLGHDTPTDVLSFPSHETDPDSGALYLGDIAVSYPRAQVQAQQGGHAVTDELQLLVVHGVLHLLGHDHADDRDRAAMWKLQGEILTNLGCSLANPSA